MYGLCGIQRKVKSVISNPFLPDLSPLRICDTGMHSASGQNVVVILTRLSKLAQIWKSSVVQEAEPTSWKINFSKCNTHQMIKSTDSIGYGF